MVMKAGKAVYGQMERIVKALLGLSADKDPKTYSESRTLLTAICNMEFIFGLGVLKVILSNTNNLSDIFRGTRSTSSPLVKCQHDHSDPTTVSE